MRSRCTLRSLRIALLVFLLGGSAARAGTFTVPLPYPTIQAGIHAASSGDTVLVSPGVYTGSGNREITLEGKDVVVRSRDGAASTTIDCAAAGRAFHAYSGETNAAAIEGFTIIHGFVGVNQNGGGILCEQSSPTIRECVIRLCMVGGTNDGDGGGINCRDSAARIIDCTITGNSAFWGGGIACRGSLPIVITGCTITENLATHGGGIDTGGIGAPVISDCLISGNSAAGGWGGGILLGGSPVVTDCMITGNYASIGGGVGSVGGTPSVAGCTVAGNFAHAGGGGGIAAMTSSTQCERTILWGNCASTLGNEIDAESAGAVSLTCCIIDPSQAVQNGGAIHFGANNVNADPLFCSNRPCSSAPTTQGTYSVSRYSPAHPDGSPCHEWIGSGRVGCPPSGVDSPATGSPIAMLGDPAPNPTRGSFVCAIRLSGPSRVVLKIVDPSGRTAATCFDGFLPSGESKVPIDLSSPGERSLPSGAYMIRLTALGRDESRRFTLIR
jgi:hypothetical protein